MQNLAIIRHGDYGSDDRIDQDGKRQMLRLSEKLEPVIHGGTTVILSSTAPRALDSAAVLAEALGGIPVEQHPLLWSDNRHREDVPAALKLLASAGDQANSILVVTHLEYTEELPARFSQERQWPIPLRYSEIRKGCAVLLDCVGKTAQYL